MAAQHGAYVQTEVWQRTVSGSVHKLSNKYTCGSTAEDEPLFEMNKALQEADRCLNTCNTPALSLKLDQSSKTLTGHSFTLRLWNYVTNFSFIRVKYLASEFFCEQQNNMWIQSVSMFVSTRDMEQDRNPGYDIDLYRNGTTVNIWVSFPHIKSALVSD